MPLRILEMTALSKREKEIGTIAVGGSKKEKSNFDYRRSKFTSGRKEQVLSSIARLEGNNSFP